MADALIASSGVRDVSATLGARVGSVVLGIALQACLAWFLGPEGRGAYAVALVYASFLTMLFGLGLDGATQYFVASERVGVDRGVSTLLTIQLTTALVGVALGIAALQLPLAYFDRATPRVFWLAVLSFPPQMAAGALLLVLGSRREFTVQALLTFSQMGLRLALVLLLVRGLDFGVEGALLANLCAFALCAGLDLLFLRRRHGLRWVRPNAALVRELLGYGGRYHLAAFSTLVNAQIGVIVIATVADTESVGLFSAAVALVAYVLMLSDAVGAAIHPRIAADTGGRPELAAQAARVVGMISAVALIAIAALARPLVEIVLSPRFEPVIPLIRILAIGVAFRAGTKVLSHYFNAIDRPGIFSIATGVGVVANTALLLVLLPRFGLPGAAWAMTLAYLASGSVLVGAFRRESGLGLLASWLPRRSDLDVARGPFRELRRRLAGD